MRKHLFLIIFFYFLALMENSFFIHFKVFSFLPSLIIIAQFLITLFEDPNKNLAIFSAFWAGFFWDVFSSRKLGIGIISMLFLSLSLKLILRKYVRIPALKRF